MTEGSLILEAAKASIGLAFVVAIIVLLKVFYGIIQATNAPYNKLLEAQTEAIKNQTAAIKELVVELRQERVATGLRGSRILGIVLFRLDDIEKSIEFLIPPDKKEEWLRERKEHREALAVVIRNFEGETNPRPN